MTAQVSFTRMFVAFILSNVVPFLIQIFVDDSRIVVVCNCLVLFNSIIRALAELVKAKHIGVSEYFSYTWNFVQIFMIILSLVYFWIRLFHHGHIGNTIPKQEWIDDEVCNESGNAKLQH